MRLQYCSLAWLAAVICVIAGLPFAAADDAPGFVRMTDYQPNEIHPTAFLRATADSEKVDCVTVECGEDKSCLPANSCSVPDDDCSDDDCSEGDCSEGACDADNDGCDADNDGCDADNDGCDADDDSCDANSRGCGCGCPGKTNGCWLGKLFGGAKSRCSCYSCDYCGKRSGASGHGVPFFGCYQVTYSHQPAYADTRDGQAWGAQGYGMPVTVPTAPIVRYSYNYSHGTPASRLTPLSTYNPATSPKQLFLQSW